MYKNTYMMELIGERSRIYVLIRLRFSHGEECIQKVLEKNYVGDVSNLQVSDTQLSGRPTYYVQGPDSVT